MSDLTMADVEVTALSSTELMQRKADIDNHLMHCCRARDGSCPHLVDLGEVQFLLGKDNDHGSR